MFFCVGWHITAFISVFACCTHRHRLSAVWSSDFGYIVAKGVGGARNDLWRCDSAVFSLGFCADVTLLLLFLWLALALAISLSCALVHYHALVCVLIPADIDCLIVQAAFISLLARDDSIVWPSRTRTLPVPPAPQPLLFSLSIALAYLSIYIQVLYFIHTSTYSRHTSTYSRHTHTSRHM